VANIDYAVYLMHGVFWSMFGVTLLVLRWRDRGAPAPQAPAAHPEATAPYSRALVAAHGVAFALMYMGMGGKIIPHRVPQWFPGQRGVGSLVIVAGGALMSWSLTAFRSWRFRAKIDRDHQLATDGPFRFIRHPIYMGLNMLALGTAVWVPALLTWLAVAAMAVGGDLRARAEEKLLVTAFGGSYTEFMSRTSRFIPGLY
jgi:protein-S-isoprenylcysteine O-methyltransferase Ste14